MIHLEPNDSTIAPSHEARRPAPTQLPSYVHSLEEIEQRLLSIAEKAKAFVHKVTNKEGHLVGSLALGVFSKDSDVDIAIAVDEHELPDILRSLSEITEFRGERIASSTTTRHLFCTVIEGTHVDINVMREPDCAHLRAGMEMARASMSDDERNSHTERRIALKQQDNKVALDVFKLELYERFCPNLVWIPDFQIREALKKDPFAPFGQLRVPSTARSS